MAARDRRSMGLTVDQLEELAEQFDSYDAYFAVYRLVFSPLSCKMPGIGTKRGSRYGSLRPSAGNLVLKLHLSKKPCWILLISPFQRNDVIEKHFLIR
ncbi:unnamed protein product [Cyprideis torosa]|uniref:Uncharacterized protein n=1 Tax=Cyprideis torosa TaxID=163714 RepID=A0A7R8ZL25_9CRUS|nr:unnamed protein product [Cyprideis torosa]CAG0882716.1 unnamed protein product [Cyprideis torosa]